MDALQLLRDDHRKVKDLFRQFAEAEDGSTRKAIVDEAVAELMIHAQLEEEVFYPAMRREGMTELVNHSEEEHHAAEIIMEDLIGTDARGTQLQARFQVLVDIVNEHITEEESQMFPRAAELGMARMETLGDRLYETRQHLLTQPRRQPARRTTTATTTKTTARKPTAASRAKKAVARVKTAVVAKADGSPTHHRLEDRTKEELYEQAQRQNVEGRSEMSKEELAEALRR
jgi:Hemerythrin HHE cation binding domain